MPLPDEFLERFDFDPVDVLPDPVPQSAFMGDECRCADCMPGEPT